MGGKTGTTTSSVAIPPEVLARYNDVNKQAQTTAGTPFQQYSTDPSAFVAPLNTEQQAATAQTNQYANAAQPALQYVEQGYTPQGFQQGVQGYMNPFLSNAMGTTAAQMNNVNQQQQQQMIGSAIGQGAFGGDRANIGLGNLENQQNLAEGQTLGQMASQGFQNAAQNYQTGLGQIGNFAVQGQQAGLQGAQAMMGAGTLAQQTEQAGKSALYNQFQQQQAYPFQVSQFLANIAEGTGALSGSTTTQTGPQSWFGSDVRLKHDIKRVGTAKNGLPIYTFKYKGDNAEQTHVGYMAQDVEKVHPEAVAKDQHGIRYVNYDKASEPVHRAFGGLNLNPAANLMTGGGDQTSQDPEWLKNHPAPEGHGGDNKGPAGFVTNHDYSPSSGYGGGVAGALGNIGSAVGGMFGGITGDSGVGGTEGQGMYARGGVTNSEGGVVAPEHSREGYFYGGDVINPNDLSALLAQQKQMYAPFQQGGLYGGQAGGTPGGKGVVPAANLFVPHLAVANPARTQQGDTLMGDVQNAMNIGDTIKKANDYRKDIIGHPAVAAQAAVPANAQTGAAAQPAVAAQDATGLEWLKTLGQPQGQAHGGVVGYADGGGVEPYQTDDPMSQVVSDTEQDKNKHGLMTAQNPTGQPSSTLGDLGKIASLAALPGEIASGAGAAASGIGSLMAMLAPVGLASGGVVGREHHAGPNDTNGQSNVVGNGDQTPAPDDYTVNAAKELLRQREGLLTNAKYDTNAYRTGYGSDTVTQPDGTVVPVKSDTSITKDDAERDLARRTGITQNDIQSKIGADTWNKLTPDARVALTSTAYNYGSLPDSVASVAQNGQASDIATAINNLGGDNEGINAVRRSKEASLIDPQGKYDPMAPQPKASAATAPNATAPKSFGDALMEKAQDPNVLLSILSGLGTMAGSNSRYLGAAILQGIGGGADTYKSLQQQGIERMRANAEVQAKNLEVAKYYQGNFIPALNASGQKIYRNKLTGEEIPQDQYNSIMGGVMGQLQSGGGLGGAAAVAQGNAPTQGNNAPAQVSNAHTQGNNAPAQVSNAPTNITDDDITAHQYDYNWLTENAQKFRVLASSFVGLNPEQQNLLESRANDMQRRADAVVNTQHATPNGSAYVIRPGATPLKDSPATPIDENTLRGQIDSDTGKITSAPATARDIGFHSTGGFYPDVYPDNAQPTGPDARVVAQKQSQGDVQQNFESSAQGTKEGINSIIKFATAAQQLESKGLNMTKAEYSNMLRGLGLGSAADMVSSQKDDAAAYTATKAALDSAISTSNASFSKPTQSEFGTIAEKGSPNIDAPVDTSHSLAQTRLAGFLWQQQLYHDWKQDQQSQGVSNFASYVDRWKSLHPSSMFEDAADRLLGNFKGQDLPKAERVTEGVTYVVPDNASNDPSSEAIRQKALESMNPGDLFTAVGVKHDKKLGKVDFDLKKIKPQDAYLTHLSAPGLQYGN